MNQPAPATSAAEDLALVERAQKDPRAFEPLYRKYYGPVFRFVFKRVRREADAQDLTQQVFIKALQNLGSYTHRGYAFSAWLFRIALNEIADGARRNQKLRAIHAGYAQAAALLEEVSTPQATEQQLGQALNALGEEDRMLVELRYFEQRKLKDIAVILDWSESNAKVRMHRTLKRLRTALENTQR